MTTEKLKELEKQAQRCLGCKKTWIPPEELLELTHLALLANPITQGRSLA